MSSPDWREIDAEAVETTASIPSHARSREAASFRSPSTSCTPASRSGATFAGSSALRTSAATDLPWAASSLHTRLPRNPVPPTTSVVMSRLSQLSHRPECVPDDPALGDLALGHPEDPDADELDLLARRRDAHEVPVVRAPARPAGDDLVVLDDDVVEGDVGVREGAVVHPQEVLH